jgi:hypothetical protein
MVENQTAKPAGWNLLKLIRQVNRGIYLIRSKRRAEDSVLEGTWWGRPRNCDQRKHSTPSFLVGRMPDNKFRHNRI